MALGYRPLAGAPLASRPAAVGGAGNTVAVPAANVTYAGAAPSVKQPHTVATPAANVTYAAPAPTVARGAAQTILVPKANVTYAGVAPAVVTGAGRVVQVPTANVTYAGPAPTISQPRTIPIPKANVTYAGPAPQVVRGMLIKPPAGNVTYTGRAPTIVQGGGNLIAVPSANINYTGPRPTILIGGVALLPPAALAQLYGGRLFHEGEKKRKKKEDHPALEEMVIAIAVDPDLGKEAVVRALPKPLQRELLPDLKLLELYRLVDEVKQSSAAVRSRIVKLYEEMEDEEDEELLFMLM